MAADLQAKATALIRNTKAHVTQPRIRVLAILLAARRDLSHDEIMALVPPGEAVDRVTVYRVLDWLTVQGLARRSIADDRVFRFAAAAPGQARAARADFKCNQCGRVRRVRSAGAPQIRLPQGFRSHYVETLIVGTCPDCSRTH
jgi:Fur family ferric uptake transcriptional regulator